MTAPAVRVTNPAMIAQACPDCVPVVHRSEGRTATGEAAVVVGVSHERSCPMFAVLEQTPAAVDGVVVEYQPGVVGPVMLVHERQHLSLVPDQHAEDA